MPTWDCFSCCAACEKGVVLVVGNFSGGSPQHQTPAQCPSDPVNWTYKVLAIAPEPKPSRVPDHIPAQLTKFFLQAADALKRQDWDASGAMSRKTVDVSTKLLMKGAATQHRDMKPRIDALAASGQLT